MNQKQKIKEVMKALRKHSLARYDYFSLFLGFILANLVWAVQPTFSQGRYLIENCAFNSTFFFVAYLFLFPLIGILLYRLFRIMKIHGAFAKRTKGEVE